VLPVRPKFLRNASDLSGGAKQPVLTGIKLMLRIEICHFNAAGHAQRKKVADIVDENKIIYG